MIVVQKVQPAFYAGWNSQMSMNVIHNPIKITETKGGTLPKTRIAPENRSSQKESSLPTINFQVLCQFQGE